MDQYLPKDNTLEARWHLKTNPFEVQLEALRRAKDKPGYGYFMQMGLGKTLVTLAEFADLLFKDEVDVQIVVCPNSLKANWKVEAEKHGLDIPWYVWPDVPPVAHLKPPFGLSLNYESIGVGRGEDYLEALMKQHRCILTLDESVQIKTPKSLRTKAALRLRKLAKFKRILSGAPFTQGPHDLWSQFLFIDAIPSNFNYFAFKARYCRMGGFMGKKVIGVQNEDLLNETIHSNGFRARKEDWLDLPDKLYTIRQFEMTKHQKEHYLELEREFFTTINDADVTPMMAVTKLLKLQQVSSGFIIADDRTAHDIEGGCPKLTATKEILEEADGKVIIVAVFQRSIDRLMSELEDYKPCVIRGGMTNDEIEVQKTEFNTGKDRRVIILQEQSAKYGHTLLGSQQAGLCHTTIFYENSYSLDDRVQVEDRNHRIGQTNKVLYIDLACSPVDLRAVEALQKKRNLLEYVVDGVRSGKLTNLG